MSLRKRRKTELMRVPSNFSSLVSKITIKRGYPSKTEFLDKEGTRIFSNADYLSDLLFSRRRKKDVKK